MTRRELRYRFHQSYALRLRTFLAWYLLPIALLIGVVVAAASSA